MLEKVDKDKALADLRKLTGEIPICINNECYTITNRLTGSEGARWAENYIFNNLIELGYNVKVQDWSRSGYQDKNIIARKPRTIFPNEEI